MSVSGVERNNRLLDLVAEHGGGSLKSCHFASGMLGRSGSSLARISIASCLSG
jgi:hypothetical protein